MAIADIDEAKSNVASVRYQGYLTAGVERWREYKEQLAPLDKKPLLFIMMNTTEEAEDVGDWLRSKYPGDFGGEHKTLVIHTDKSGEISKKDLDKARKLAREVDDPDCPTNAIVSVAFLTFVDDLEKLEDIQLETFEVGKDKLKIISISPQVPEKAAYDLSLPRITPVLVRKKSLHAEIEGLDVRNFIFSPDPLPRKPTIADIKRFQYSAFDILTMEKIFEREYAIRDAQQPNEIVSYYAKVIASYLKLPGQFAALAPRVWQFFEERAFGEKVDLYNSAIIQAMNHRVAGYVVLDVFARALREKLIEQVEPDLEGADRMLSSMQTFAFSRSVLEARKCVLNMVPCDQESIEVRYKDTAA